MPGKYAPWMHLEHYLAPLPWAAKGLRRLVRQDPAVPLLPVGAKLVCQAVARKRITNGARSLGVQSGVESADAAGVLMGCLLFFDVFAQDVDGRTTAA